MTAFGRRGPAALQRVRAAGPLRRLADTQTVRRVWTVNEPPSPLAAVRRVARLYLEELDPALRRAVPLDGVGWAMVAVYRRRNASAIVRFIDENAPAAVALWALDREAPELSRVTLGVGSGMRFPLANRLVTTLGERPADEWLGLIDDDVAMTSGSVVDVIAWALASGIDLAQPAHDRRSHLSWNCTAHHLLSLVRLTRFVEQGPVVLLGPAARQRLLPFPEDIGMGWGAEALWSMHPDLRLGIVDAVLMRHSTRVGGAGGYELEPEWARAGAMLQEATGLQSFTALQRTTAVWRSWQRTAPWSVDLERGVSGSP